MYGGSSVLKAGSTDDRINKSWALGHLAASDEGPKLRTNLD